MNDVKGYRIRLSQGSWELRLYSQYSDIQRYELIHSSKYFSDVKLEADRYDLPDLDKGETK